MHSGQQPSDSLAPPLAGTPLQTACSWYLPRLPAMQLCTQRYPLCTPLILLFQHSSCCISSRLCCPWFFSPPYSEACGDTMSSSDGTAADASWERSDGRSRPPPTVNTIRRIRQACTNCRCAQPTNQHVSSPVLAGPWAFSMSKMKIHQRLTFLCDSSSSGIARLDVPASGPDA